MYMYMHLTCTTLRFKIGYWIVSSACDKRVDAVIADRDLIDSRVGRSRTLETILLCDRIGSGTIDQS